MQLEGVLAAGRGHRLQRHPTVMRRFSRLDPERGALRVLVQPPKDPLAIVRRRQLLQVGPAGRHDEEDAPAHRAEPLHQGADRRQPVDVVASNRCVDLELHAERRGRRGPFDLMLK